MTIIMRSMVSFILVWTAFGAPASGAAHVWEKQELTFTAAQSFVSPYTEVTVWVDLTGPNFKKRVYGFWDGEDRSACDSGDRARRVVMEEWVESRGSWPQRQVRFFPRGGVVRSREGGERQPAGVHPRDAERPRLPVCRWDALFPTGRHVVDSRDLALSLVRR